MTTDERGFLPAWSVPNHRVVNLSDSQASRYCVVICVINEAQRLHRQLQRMQEVADVPDIVIADGGSDDGSTDEAALARLNVRTLLVKEGGAALGAQQRMGWAHALAQGYEGIITIDGNDKDGVDAIPRFSQCLDAGWDMVQGSRFRRGGEAVNTPLERLLAIRLVHAPLVSLAARFWFTDTTNAFRAYSRRLLLDPRVQPFRDAFQRYELLVYLSVRAPRLGFRVTEIPVNRVYPATGKVPTKISPVRGNVELCTVLLRALGHGFDPA